MAQLNGKQIKDGSISLDKMSTSSGLVQFSSSATMSFLSGAVLRTSDSNIQIGEDVVNKNYVDAVASGLDPKDAVRAVAATGSITLSGVGFQIDGWTVSSGDRILVNAQAGKGIATSSNGIYSATAGAWSRASDSDGDPLNEVSHGNFVFVTDGNIYEHSGWVLTVTDAADPHKILVGTESQLWVQFSEAANIQDGAGLSFDGQVLNVNVGTGLTISSDNVAIANTTVVANSYGQANSVTTFTVNAQGQLTAAGTQSINIISTQVSDFDTAAQNSIFTNANFVDGSTVDFTVTTGDSLAAEVTLGSLTASRLNIINPGSASQDWKLGYNSSGQFEWFDPTQGDISEVIAGNGLSGGGVAGSVTLDVNTANGLTIIGDNVQIADTAAGDGLTFSAGVFNVNTANGLTIIGDNVQIADTAAGNGLTFSSGVFDINLNTLAGLTFSGDYISINTGTTASALTFSATTGELQVVVDNSTIQVVNGQLKVVAGSSQPVYSQRNLTPSATTPGVNGQTTGLSISSTPNDYTTVNVYVNGVLQFLGDGATNSGVDCYFSNDGGTTARTITSIQSGDILYWNANLDNTQGSGFSLDITDRIDIIYQS